MCNKNLRKAIFDSGKKDFQVAKEAKMHPSTLSHLVNEHYEPTAEHKENLSRALGRSAKELFPELEPVA